MAQNFQLIGNTLSGNGTATFAFDTSLGTLQSYMFGITGVSWTSAFDWTNAWDFAQNYGVSFAVTQSGNTVLLQQTLPTWFAASSTTTVAMLGAFVSNGIYLSVQRSTQLGTTLSPAANPSSPPMIAAAVLSGFNVGFVDSSILDLCAMGVAAGAATVIGSNGGMSVGTLGTGFLEAGNALDVQNSNVTTGFLGFTQDPAPLGLSIAPAYMKQGVSTIAASMPGISTIAGSGSTLQCAAFIQSFALSFGPGSALFQSLTLGTSSPTTSGNQVNATMLAGMSGNADIGNQMTNVGAINPAISYVLVAVGTPE